MPVDTRWGHRHFLYETLENIPMKSIVSSILLLAFSLPAVAEDASSPDTGVKHALGASVGWIVGSGISYRHYFGDAFIQSGFIASAENFNDDSKTNNDVYVDFAVAYGRYVHIDRENKWVPLGLKWLIGIEGIYNENPGCRFDFASSSCVETRNIERTVHVGGGIGLDVGQIRAQGLIVSFDLNFLATFEEGEFEGVHAPWPALSVLYNW